MRYEGGMTSVDRLPLSDESRARKSGLYPGELARPDKANSLGARLFLLLIFDTLVVITA